MSALMDNWGFYVAAIGIALFAHEPWRWMGVYFGRTVSEDDAIFRWVRLVSTALVAGLVMRFVIFPAGVLSDIHHLARIGALVVGVAGYFVFGRNLGAGVLVSCVALVGLAYVL